MSKTRKKMEKKPWQEQQELKIILDASPIGFSWSDMQGNIKYINRRFQELFGYNVDDISNIDAWLFTGLSISRLQGAGYFPCCFSYRGAEARERKLAPQR